MSREPQMPAAMMAAFAGMQSGGAGVASAFAVALVMHTLAPWREPTGKDLERALRTAERFKLTEDLAIFLPPEPGRFAGRAKKDAYKGVVIALKRVDELAGDERAEAISQVRGLLGAG
ncbi:MAG: hypothetical protein CVT66_01445 [Actinobacteria bacterium HGW-Actinobacteria-6]|nr:MAG: hypothetical protein CVT66_01445 [Actinobacteria bacterium HGW-Actinobacteria-6]